MSRESRSSRGDRAPERGEEREAISLGEDSAFNLPQSFLKKNPHKRYAFIPYICGGKELPDDLYDAQTKRGFSYTLASENPELSRRKIVSPFQGKEDDNLIKIKGQVLMERSVEDAEREEEIYRKRNEAIEENRLNHKIHHEGSADHLYNSRH